MSSTIPNGSRSNVPSTAATAAASKNPSSLTQLYNQTYAASQIFARRSLQSWGRFVATRPIAVLLLCCVFLCALTYPVLSLYAWASPSSASGFFSFLRTAPTLHLVGDDGSIARARDLKLPWQSLDSVVLNGEEACWQRIPKFREVTVQQVLLGFPADGRVASEHGVLDRKPLHGVYNLQKRLHEVLTTPQNRTSLACVQSLDAQTMPNCFTLSPLAYWGQNENDMLSDTSLIATVNQASLSVLPFPLQHDDLFIGRSYAGNTLRKADYAVLTLFLEGDASPSAVTSVVHSIAQELGYVLVERSAAGSRAVMKHRSEVRVRATAWEDVLFYMGYFIVGTYIYLTLRRLDKVHSRMGLVVTGIVQMLASGVMSLSLCALSGYKFNLVPVKLIPFLIVVLGVDNMFVLTTAVTSTSINLPVKERIAEGLAQSGVGIFLNLVMELTVCVVLYIATQAEVIREMAVFSAVALIVDYIMEMTYFITVLSIDMHRLELADFLTQGSGSISPSDQRKIDGAGLPRFLEIMINSVQDRRARTYTAVILIGSNYLLYLLYGKDYFVPAFCSNIQHAAGSKLAPGSPTTPSEIFWQALGARPSEAIHVHILLPVVLFFDSFNTTTNFYTIARASILAAFKFVVLPISLTTFGLYLLLAQLLKGTDQRQHNLQVPGPDAVQAEAETYDQPGLGVSSTQYNTADVELLALSDNGRFCVSWVALEGRIRLWNVETGHNGATDGGSRLELPFGQDVKTGESLTHLAISADGARIAASTNSRRIIIWQAVTGSSPAFVSDASLQSRSRILSLLAEPTRDARQSPPRATGQRSPSDSLHPGFLSTHEDGSVWRWQCFGEEPRRLFPAVSAARPCIFATSKASGPEKVLVRITAIEEVIHAWRYSPASLEWRPLGSFSMDAATGTVTSTFVLQEGPSSLLVLGRSTGFVEVYHLELEKQVFVARLHEGAVRQVRLVSVPYMQCPMCKSPVTNSLGLTSSDASALFVTRLQTPKTEACDCENGLSGQMATFPSVFSHTSSPSRKVPSPQASADDSSKILAYPLSPHALRRLSHATDRRKADESPRRVVDPNVSMADLGSPPPKSHSKAPSELRLPGINGEVEETWSFLHLGSMALDIRDRWDVCASHLVGVRKSSSHSQSSNASPLRRWEAWTCSLQTLKLSATGSLAPQVASVDKLPPEIGHASTRSQLPFSRVRHFMVSDDGGKVTATFGNLICNLTLHSPSAPLTRKLSLEYS